MINCIDFHTHIFPDHVADRAVQSLTEAYDVKPEGAATVAGLLATMEQAGVDRAVVCPVATRPDQVTSVNRWVSALDRSHIIPFGAMHPGVTQLKEELSFLRDQGVRGIKLQPHFQGYELDDPAFLRMFEKLADLVILIHAGQEIRPIPNVAATPERLRKLHDRFPQHRMVLAHLGSYQMWQDVRHYLVGTGVYFDLAYTFDELPDQEIAEIIALHGDRRIMFASDYPWQPPATARDGLERLRLPEEQRQRILSGNAVELLGL